MLNAIAERLCVDPNRLVPGVTLERNRSRVTPIVMDGRIAAWHKQIRTGDEVPGMPDVTTARVLLGRAKRCSDAVIQLLADEADLTLAAVLAVDVDELIVATAHVHGRPIGTPLARFARGPKLLSRQLRATGRVLAILESATPVPTVAGGPDPSDAEARIAGHLAKVAANPRLLPRGLDLDLVRDRAAAALQSIQAAGYPAAYVHGDVSPSNVLVTGRRIGLIDAEWPCRLMGFDLAALSVRLELSSWLTPALGSWLVAQLTKGYETVNAVGAGFHFERTQRLLRLLATGSLVTPNSRRVASAYLGTPYPCRSDASNPG